MRFYDRVNEIEIIRRGAASSAKSSSFTFVVGRRRIGKTAMILEALKDERYLYLFVARKTEELLCGSFAEDAERVLGIKLYGRVEKFRDLLEALLDHAVSRPFTLVIDEFQDFERVDKAIFSEIQDVWDRHKKKPGMNLIASGSVYSMMIKQFEDLKEPLYGRADAKLHIEPFSVRTMKEILHDFNPAYRPDDLLCLYMITGGSPQYISLLMDHKAVTKDKMLKYVFSVGSSFLTDGRDTLISEFGADYSTYFSILQLIASGKTKQGEIDSIIGKNTGAYLHNLEKKYNVIRKHIPIFAKPESRNASWGISDLYLRFWFAFIFPHQSLVEAGRYDLLLENARDRYNVYSGYVLEDFFRKRIAEEESYTAVGRSWDKKGTSEIDVIALDKTHKRALIAEVKRDIKRYDRDRLIEKAESIKTELAGFETEYMGLSLDDM